jgi:serine/threonine-protein kinase
MPDLADRGVATRLKAVQRAKRLARDRAHSLPLDSLIAGRYRVVAFLGRGGMGEVYSVYDAELQRSVALKIVLPTTQDSDHGLAQLTAEAGFGLSVSHPHVCRVFEQGVHAAESDAVAPLPFLTMELIDGPRLGTLLRKRTLERTEAMVIARQLLCGLEALHDAGVLHLDLKSDNVMLRHAWRPHGAVIIDFGLSASRHARRGREPDKVAGTVSYMAPERVLALGPSVESDVYSFGVILFEMLAGRLPFGPDPGSPAASVIRRLTDPPPPPSAFAEDVPPALDAFVLRCLEGSRRRRFRAAREALAAFDAVT